jgi:hypothetical protein
MFQGPLSLADSLPRLFGPPRTLVARASVLDGASSDDAMTAGMLTTDLCPVVSLTLPVLSTALSC